LNIEVVVCTKDRPEKLEACVPRFKEQIPFDTFTVYEGSKFPSKDVIEKLEPLGVNFQYVHGKLFGAVRKAALVNSQADYVAMVDDDIFLSKDWFKGLMREFKDPDVVAVSSRLIYTGHPVLESLYKGNTRTSGGSGGAAIYKRKAIVDLGNFSDEIHRGEDMELELRIQAAGKKWRKSQSVYALHPVESLREFLQRPKANVVGWNYIMRYSQHKWRFIGKRVASTFLMPIYYFWKTGDPRTAAVWFIYKWRALSSFLSGEYER